jgi:hypothetical protein
VATDCFMRVPGIRVAEARLEAGEADTWMYRFDRESPSFARRSLAMPPLMLARAHRGGAVGRVGTPDAGVCQDRWLLWW